MRKNLQTVITFLLFVLLLPGTGLVAQAADHIRIRVDGEYLQLEYGQHPVVVEGHTLVPIREVMAYLGFTVEWDSQSSTVSLDKPGFSVSVTIGSSIMTVNNRVVSLEVPAQIISERTMIPLRAISEATNLTVHWISEAKIVDIRTDGSGPELDHHYISWPFSIYLQPDFRSGRVANLDPQTVNVLYEGTNGWALISTWLGDRWVNLDVSSPLFTSEPLPNHIIEFITGRSFSENTTFPFSYLTYLTITHVGFDGEDKTGHMIVAAEIGDEVLDIFREIYESGFPIYRMQLIDYFDASDNLSMAANNSHAFNFRNIAGTNILSRHAFGRAIDINPIQNPYISGSYVSPAAGREYLDRTNVRPGMIIKGDAVYRAFTSRGWTWGGDWTSIRDFHHFERR